MQARDPRADAPAAGGGCRLTATMDWEGQQAAMQPSRAGQAHFKLGEVRRRTDGVAEQLQCDDDGVNAKHNMSVDAALFPLLHPRGLGSASSYNKLSELLQQRMQQLFSPFTLVREYLLIMFQVGGWMSLPWASVM